MKQVTIEEKPKTTDKETTTMNSSNFLFYSKQKYFLS